MIERLLVLTVIIAGTAGTRRDPRFDEADLPPDTAAEDEQWFRLRRRPYRKGIPIVARETTNKDEGIQSPEVAAQGKPVAQGKPAAQGKPVAQGKPAPQGKPRNRSGTAKGGKTPEPGRSPNIGKTLEPVRSPKGGKTPEPGRSPKGGKTPEPARSPKGGKTPEPAVARSSSAGYLSSWKQAHYKFWGYSPEQDDASTSASSSSQDASSDAADGPASDASEESSAETEGEEDAQNQEPKEWWGAHSMMKKVGKRLVQLVYTEAESEEKRSSLTIDESGCLQPAALPKLCAEFRFETCFTNDTMQCHVKHDEYSAKMKAIKEQAVKEARPTLYVIVGGLGSGKDALVDALKAGHGTGGLEGVKINSGVVDLRDHVLLESFDSFKEYAASSQVPYMHSDDGMDNFMEEEADTSCKQARASMYFELRAWAIENKFSFLIQTPAKRHAMSTSDALAAGYDVLAIHVKQRAEHALCNQFAKQDKSKNFQTLEKIVQEYEEDENGLATMIGLKQDAEAADPEKQKMLWYHCDNTIKNSDLVCAKQKYITKPTSIAARPSTSLVHVPFVVAAVGAIFSVLA